MPLLLPDDLPTGTLLQNRYRIQRVLGKGGFGRAYLAEDQSRFSELCVLKEFTPQQQGGEELRKAKALFQREAEILYKLEHRQIPKFHATFEQDQRLFLVQDYIKGKTYQELLDELPPETPLLSEGEAIQLLEQMLNVLKYLHHRSIIHRDISPDNIILRDQDKTPVLIDFGAVKEATGMSHPASRTKILKKGFSPPEQAYLGKPVNSSDLYALAVTLVVLLTGRQPDELYDPIAKTWRWERWVRVSPRFATILNRMLSDEVGNRYPSADEILLLLPTVMPLATRTAQPAHPSATTRPTPTINVGRAPAPGTLTHPDYSWWDRAFAAIGSFTWRVSSRLARSFGKLLWEVAKPLLRWSEGIITGSLKFLIKLLLVVGLGWLVWTSIVQSRANWMPKFENPFESLPKFENPIKSLPKFENPFESLPKLENPFANPPLSMSARKQRYKNRVKELGLDESCLVGKIDAEFYSQHPDLDGRSLSQNDPEALWLEWYSIADRLMADSNTSETCKMK
ncbi:serine/threonine protein kinase [Kovacikia minuta CCNUW1]|uniref:serine/threonine-protein kinase n=1 Tax=Kovacikia minuta TaxID=2931930 RepID=UPI001CCF2D92|nr:serine/threonine-protein kinase [Kovacikia minuta]UBF26202.1 serine/threonine protein kinase [Kovacikia minuta CCNUW1]